MIPFSKLRKLLNQKSDAEAGKIAPLPVDQTMELEPVPIDTDEPGITAADDDNAGTASIRSLGDTQQMDNEVISEQLDNLRQTIKAGAFENKEEKTSVVSVTFGNHPPTIEMERPQS